MKLLEYHINLIEILGHSSYIPKQYFNPMITLGWEKQLLKKHYEFLKVRIDGSALICVGTVTPSQYSATYTYKVKFIPGKKPKVYSIEPKIEYHQDIHLYPHDNSLCLYYPADFSWTSTSHLYNTIIPWTHEWYLFYELYQIYGVWMHPEVSHNGLNKKE
jgi:hypothetical protein